MVRSWITREISRLAKSEKPEHTWVCEDFEDECNAEISLLGSFLLKKKKIGFADPISLQKCGLD